MNMTRRSFASYVALASVFATVGSNIACTFASVFAAIEKYVPVGLSAFGAILSILTGAGVVINPAVSAIVALVKIGFADLAAAIAQYQAAPTGQKTGLLGAISEALTVVESNIQQFWADLQIPDAKLSALIEGLLGVITTTLAGFLTQLPASITPKASAARSMKMSLAKQLPSTPIKRSLHQFKKDFNAQLGTGYSQHAV